MTPPIIDRPDRVGRKRRTLFGALTAIAWLFYAYLWMPLLTLMAWIVGARTAWNRLYLEQNVVDPFLLLSLPVIALVCGLLLVGWAEYNRARFAKADERRRRAQVGDADVDDVLGAAHPLAERLRDSRIARVTLDDDAAPSRLQVVARD